MRWIQSSVRYCTLCGIVRAVLLLVLVSSSSCCFAETSRVGSQVSAPIGKNGKGVDMMMILSTRTMVLRKGDDGQARVKVLENMAKEWMMAVGRVWMPRTARVWCTVSDGHGEEKNWMGFRVYVGKTEREVQEKRKKGDAAWCGWRFMLDKAAGLVDRNSSVGGGMHTAHACHVKMPTYGSYALGVDVSEGGGKKGFFDRWSRRMEGGGWKLVVHGEEESMVKKYAWQSETVAMIPADGLMDDKNDSDERQSNMNVCYVEHSSAFSSIRAALWMVGIAVLLNASRISTSLSFRLTAGAFTFMCMSGILLLYVIWKNVPHKKSMIVTYSMFGGGVALLLRLARMPSEYLLGWVSSPIFYVYLGMSGLVGMAVTYYFMSEDDVKIAKILEVGLGILGIVIMMWSATTIMGGIAMFVASIAVVRALPVCINMVSLSLNQKIRGRAREFTTKKLYFGHGATFMQDTGEERPKSPLNASGVPETTRRPEPNYGSFSQRQEAPPHTPTTFRVSTVGTPPTPEDFANEVKLSEIVKRGKIVNVETDRTIGIGKSTYNNLFMKGYVVDFVEGTITPPDKAKKID
eukprot:jgi/Picsp_1/3533/NSC_06371-R1_hypothetical protein CHLNCDRAFT_133177 [Chlorella variabilis]